MLAARVEPKNGPKENKKIGNFKPLILSEFQAAVDNCRTAALGGHVARCENANCGHTQIAYNSCLMGTSGNGELARPAAAFSYSSPCLRSPLHEPLRPGSARPLAAAAEGRNIAYAAFIAGKKIQMVRAMAQCAVQANREGFGRLPGGSA